MSNPGLKYQKAKGDITPYLFHFIKGKESNPKDVLSKILDEQMLCSQNGYICFTASPITRLKKFFETKVYGTNHPMYHPYGIGFARDLLIRDYGARNLIYCSMDEREKMSEEFRWRTDLLDVDSYDFEWLREWRIKGNEFDFSQFPKEHIIVVAPTADDTIGLVVSDEPEEYEGQDSTGEYYYEFRPTEYKRKWNGFSLKQINLHQNDFELSGSTETQNIGKSMVKDIYATIALEKSEKK